MSAKVIPLHVRRHADLCPCCGRVARMFLFSRCQTCISLGRCPDLDPSRPPRKDADKP